MSEEISFKSVGVKSTDRKFTQKIDTKPIGIKTPLQLGTGRSGLFQMHFNRADQIADNLRNLILTNKGERLGRFDYGANLREMTTEITSKENWDAEAMMRIRDATQTFMPYVELETFVSSFDTVSEFSGAEPGVGKIKLKIIYSIPQLRVAKQQMNVDLYVIG